MEELFFPLVFSPPDYIFHELNEENKPPTWFDLSLSLPLSYKSTKQEKKRESKRPSPQ